jgi:peptidoglycan/LPS O-acetylase OafA/YrhL
LEEQFYMLLPFAMILLPRKRLIFGLAALIGLQLFLYRPHWSPQWAVRTDALTLGALIALWQKHASYRVLEPLFLRHRRFAIPVFVALVVMIAALPSNLEVVSFSTGSLALCCAALVLIASYDRDYLWPRGVGKWILVWVGSRSYSLYLTHLVCFAMTREFWFRISPTATRFDASYTVPFLATAFGLTVLFSELNFRLLEAPMRRRGRDLALVIAAKLSIDTAGARPVLTRIPAGLSTAATSERGLPAVTGK